MGLGKTVGVCAIGGRAKLQRWLIICPDNAFSVWRDEAPRWIEHFWPEADVMSEFIDQAPDERLSRWNGQVVLEQNRILLSIVTYDTFIRDWGETVKIPGKRKKMVRFRPRSQYQIPNIVVLDEAKRIRNPESISFRVIQRFLEYYNVQRVFPMTGTPGHQPRHFWTMLNIIDPKYFRSYWKFIYAFHEVIDNGWGQEILEPKNLIEWHKLLVKYFSVVKEDDEGIADQRPPMTRQLLTIDMEPAQKTIYDNLIKDLFHIDTESGIAIVAQNELALATRLRQVLICPAILDPSAGVGAAIKDFADTVEPGDHNVIFTPFTKAFPHFQEYLEGRKFKTHLLYGGMGTSQRDSVLQEYKSSGGTVICSTLYAQAFSLEPATRSFAIGYDWDPDNNRQAEKRLHRLTTTNPVTAYYYTFRSTFDERLCNILNIKMEHLNLTIPGNLRKFVKGEL